MISEAKKTANKKWDKENMSTLSCRMRTDEANDFKTWCSINHTTPGNLLKKYVNKCLNEYYDYLEELHKDDK